MTDAKLREYEELANAIRYLARTVELPSTGPRVLRESADAIDALVAVVRKMPVTADGVRIVPEMDLWEVVPHLPGVSSVRVHKNIAGVKVGPGGVEAVLTPNGVHIASDGGTFYSTHEAAERAAGEGKGEGGGGM